MRVIGYMQYINILQCASAENAQVIAQINCVIHVVNTLFPQQYTKTQMMNNYISIIHI